MTTKTVDPLFAAYAASAPRLDLESYVTYAQAHRDEFSEATRQIVREMLTLLDTLYAKPDQASSKRAVWTLIDRFKCSIPQWYDGGTGQHESFAASAIALYVTHGRSGVLLDPKTPLIEASEPQTRSVQKPVAQNWRARAEAAEQRVRELEQRLAKPTAPRPTRVPRLAPAVVVEGTRVCRQCSAEQAIDQFTWGDGGRTVRSLCRTCRKQQQADRRQAVAA